MKYWKNKAVFGLSLLLILGIRTGTFAGEKAKNSPKNIIIMISDGCGYDHITAAAMFKFGKPKGWAYQDFPVQYAMSTYSASSSYDPEKAWADFDYVKTGKTDSAASATALAAGVKTYNGAICVDPNKKPLKNVVERCEELGKATGVISSVPWPHATPAGFVAHNEKRGNYDQISREMIFESGLEVAMGPGHPYYDNNGKQKDEASYKYIEQDTWNALVKGTASCDADGDGKADPWTLIQTKEQFLKLMTGGTPKRVCGTVCIRETLQQKRDGDENAAPYQEPLIKTVPNLREMTKAAINVLDDDPDGFFLMIEGGAVDWACHKNQTGRLIEEEIEFSNTVEAIIEWIEKNSSWSDTLLIVTADHETGYLTGPESGKKDNGPVWNPIKNCGKYEVPLLEWNSTSHTNSLIPFFAKGKGSEFFRKAATNTDPVRGKYIDNTDIARTIFALLE